MTELVPGVCLLAEPNMGLHCWAWVDYARSWYCIKCGVTISDEQMRMVDGPENATRLERKAIEVWETFKEMGE